LKSRSGGRNGGWPAQDPASRARLGGMVLCIDGAAPLITPLSFCHHRKHPEIRSQNGVFQQPARSLPDWLRGDQ
jgi:hypothetical protein